MLLLMEFWWRKMYKIRCLTTGEFIVIDAHAYMAMYSVIPQKILNDISNTEDIIAMASQVFSSAKPTVSPKVYIQFNTEESAQWFINRRLTYNPSRKDAHKLRFMKLLFEANGLPDHTVKVEFEPVEF